MKPISTSTYTFPDLIEGGFAYVDKTAILRELLCPAKAQYFLARPRRFGKSLTISTLQSIFEGRRELFKGLAIDKSDYDWKTYPIIRLDLGSCQPNDADELKVLLDEMLDAEIARLGLTLRPTQTLQGKFTALCEAASQSGKNKIVILVDEYDKPLLGKLGTPEVTPIKNLLKAFYSVIKTCENRQRFAFITGISKFSKVSIFSDLNNLTDLTMMPQTATLLGYTHDEVKTNFAEHIHDLAGKLGTDDAGAFTEILKWYDGYLFHHAAEKVVNPVSLGLLFQFGEFKGYWSDTAVPTALVDYMTQHPANVSMQDVGDDELGAYEPEKISLTTLLYQTGYLTIKGFRQRGGFRRYTLDFPNQEVRNSFNSRLAKSYASLPDGMAASAQGKCIDGLYDNDLSRFINGLKALFANVPYDISARAPEQVYEAVMVTALWFIGVGVEAEVRTNEGSIDAVFKTPDRIYVVEVKRNQKAANAISQIRERHYADKYLADGRPVTLLGINFDGNRRTIDDWASETL